MTKKPNAAIAKAAKEHNPELQSNIPEMGGYIQKPNPHRANESMHGVPKGMHQDVTSKTHAKVASRTHGKRVKRNYHA